MYVFVIIQGFAVMLLLALWFFLIKDVATGGSNLMFLPRKAVVQKPQKQRRTQQKLGRVWQFCGAARWVRLIALGPGFLATGTLSRLFIWAKKACLSYKLLRRFWFNVQNAAVLTRKPANVRMGKGKGGRRWYSCSSTGRCNPCRLFCD